MGILTWADATSPTAVARHRPGRHFTQSCCSPPVGGARQAGPEVEDN
jgi:hypothetical protein